MYIDSLPDSVGAIMADPYQYADCPCPPAYREGGFCRRCGAYHPGSTDPEVLYELAESENRRRRVARHTPRQRRTEES